MEPVDQPCRRASPQNYQPDQRASTPDDEPDQGWTRGQSHVVGVVLLLGLTTVALGGLAATMGAVVDEQTSRADAASVANDLDEALQPVETTGARTGRVTFGDGQLSVESRELRVLDGNGTRQRVETDALVFESGNHRVAAVAGAIVRGRPGSPWLERRPPITTGPDVLVVGAPRLNGSGSVGGIGGVSTVVRTNVTHERIRLGEGEYAVAIETVTPRAFERYADRLNATATTRDFDGDGVASVVIDVPGSREGYLVVHDMRLEVGRG